jgi:hypothetical protein
MRGSAVFRTGVAPGGALAGPWVQNSLWTRARAVPSLDLRFADNKSLVDATTGSNLVTHTRASSATFVDSTGVLQTAVTNLLLRSEEFDNTAVWGNWVGTVTRNANTEIAPNGTLTADNLVFAAADNTVAQAVTIVSGVSYAVSLWIKGAAGQTIRFTANSIPGGSNVTLTGDWVRYSFVGVSTGTSATLNISTFGDVTARNIYVWGAQLEQSSTVGEYIPTTSTINSAPRFDHNPTTGESLGLLVEEQRTNSIRNNTMVGAVAGTPGTLPTNWVESIIATGLTRQVVGTGTSNGVTYIDVKVSGTTSNANGWSIFFDASTQIAASSGQAWAGAAYVAIIAGSTANITDSRIRIVERNSGGGYITENNVSYAAATASLINNRFSLARTFGATAAFVQYGLYFQAASGAAIDITLRIGLPQLELGAFATSVIPTTTAAVTRSADVASITGSAFSSWYRQDEGTVLMDGTNSALSTTAFAFSDGTINNRLQMDAGTNTRVARVVNGGINQASNSLAYTYNTPQKFSISYATNSINFANAGVLGTEDTSATIPAVDQAKIGANPTNANHLNGYIRRLTYWPTRLGNEVLQRITQ